MNEINIAICVVYMTVTVHECNFLSLVVTVGDMADIR